MSDDSGFIIPLLPVGDEGSSFRVRNAPGGEIQRPHLVDRGSDFTVQGDLVSVLHGHFTPEGDQATLIIAEFRFLSSKSSRRFRRAMITWQFANSDPNDGTDPEVVRIAPYGHFSINPTSKSVETKRSANISAQAGLGVGSLGTGAAWELTESINKKDQTTLAGTIRLEGRTYGESNTARWTFSENKSQSDGIPTLLRAAVLLRRKSDAQFVATIKIDAKVDMLYSLGNQFQRLFGDTWNDDLVYFDPQLKPTGEPLVDIDPENLSSYDLKSITAVESTTVISTRIES